MLSFLLVKDNAQTHSCLSGPNYIEVSSHVTRSLAIVPNTLITRNQVLKRAHRLDRCHDIGLAPDEVIVISCMDRKVGAEGIAWHNTPRCEEIVMFVS